jgi:glycosyltransferase involved in cell wall biosynthesis
MRNPRTIKPPLLILDQQSWRGGAQRVLESVLDALEHSFEIIVALPAEGPFSEQLRRRGIETWTYPLGNYQPGRKSLRETFVFAVRTLLCTVKLVRAIRKRKIRLVYINGPRCLPAGALAARLTGRPALFHLHNVLTRRIDVLLTAGFARLATRIVACSKAAVSALSRRSPGLGAKSTVIYSCVPTTSSQQDGSPAPLPAEHVAGHWVVGVVGRITEGKGHRVLMRAIARLDAHLQANIELLFVGAPETSSREDETHRQSLRQLAADLGLAEKIQWTGFQANPDAYFRRMDLVAVPSTCPEGLPLVVLEAMQRGLAIIASEVGGIPEAITDGETGLLVPPNDEGALAEALKRTLLDPDLRRRLGEAARLRIGQRFSRESFESAIRRVVTEACAPPVEPKPEAQSEAVPECAKATRT